MKSDVPPTTAVKSNGVADEEAKVEAKTDSVEAKSETKIEQPVSKQRKIDDSTPATVESATPVTGEVKEAVKEQKMDTDIVSADSTVTTGETKEEKTKEDDAKSVEAK